MHKMVASAALLLLFVAPAGFAAHGQVTDGNQINYAFNPNGFTFFQRVDWVGVGGPEQTESGALDGPTPDDCMDSDGSGQTVYGNNHLAFPTIAQKVMYNKEETIAPGQAVEAPAELIAACTLARELIFGQESDHQYASTPQQIGFGDVTSEAGTFVLPIGFFDGALLAKPLEIEARLCIADQINGFSSKGDEDWGSIGFPNGVLDGTAGTCHDISEGFVDNDELQDGGTWDPGSINSAGFSVYDIDVHDLFGDGTVELDFGLHILCMNVPLVDGNGGAAGFYEDYSYFWLDGPANNYALAAQWADSGTTDGAAYAQDCSDVGISLV